MAGFGCSENAAKAKYQKVMSNASAVSVTPACHAGFILRDIGRFQKLLVTETDEVVRRTLQSLLLEERRKLLALALVRADSPLFHYLPWAVGSVAAHTRSLDSISDMCLFL